MGENYIYVLSDVRISVAGALAEDKDLETQTVRWFSIVGSDVPLEFSSTAQAQQFLGDRVPQLLEFTIEEKIAEFAQRASRNIGRRQRSYIT
ncbi:hypothetical protein [Nostoc sp. NMS9]|uniref:hypothetical protein n=1 Tax=Nostoc sp. NMS9 TaxID=2815393 RepID=UPI0025F72890|nr:hypothetical protein [Nostoc sp. NMS9]MBN3940598.1 hypothetical protein [Nostoc sp. NMS9]